MRHVEFLYDKLKSEIMDAIPDVVLNGDEHARYKGNLNISFAYVEGESLIMALKNLAVRYVPPWPLGILFTEEVLELYNVIFRFLI